MAVPAPSPLALSLQQTVDFLRARLPAGWAPAVAIVCGSGLGGLVKDIDVLASVPYKAIPNFPHSSVEGHGQTLEFGTLGGKQVVALTGRFHGYEGHSPKDCAYGVRTVAALGCKVLVVTNAAGATNAAFEKHDIMIIQDHISFPCLAGNHPLVGPHDPVFGPRFPPVTDAYTPSLRALVRAIVAEHAPDALPRLREGTYGHCSGPTYESRHEVAMIRLVGGDVAGMSTVWEVVVAAQMGLQVVGMSLVTNKGVMPGDTATEAPSHAEVLEAANEGTSKRTMQTIVGRLCAAVDLAALPETGVAAHFKDTSGIAAHRAAAAVPAALAARIAALEAELVAVKALAAAVSGAS